MLSISPSLRIVLLATLLSMAFVVAAASRERPSAQRPEIPFAAGEPFPEIALPTLDGGEPTTLAAYRGDKIILHVFASW